MNEIDKILIIAINLFDESKSRILLEDVLMEFSKEARQLDLSEFIGQGVVIAACYEIDEVEDDGELYVTLDYKGNRQSFICFDYFRHFPLIEGVLAPGIYLLEEKSDNYFALYNNDNLSRAFDEMEEYYEIDKFKFVCSPEKITWQWLKGYRSEIDFKRHSFSYFDLFCPVCNTKLSGYETKGASPSCDFITHECPHYAGFVFYEGDDEGYDEQQLTGLNFNYKIVGSELYLENPNGDWEKPILIEYNPGDDSFHASNPDDGGIERFLFVTEI